MRATKRIVKTIPRRCPDVDEISGSGANVVDEDTSASLTFRLCVVMPVCRRPTGATELGPCNMEVAVMVLGIRKIY